MLAHLPCVIPARLAAAAMAMVAEADSTVDLALTTMGNYLNLFLPAAYPNLPLTVVQELQLYGYEYGPHNLGEAIAATKFLMKTRRQHLSS